MAIVDIVLLWRGNYAKAHKQRDILKNVAVKFWVEDRSADGRGWCHLQPRRRIPLHTVRHRAFGGQDIG